MISPNIQPVILTVCGCIQAVTRRVLAAWEVAQLAVRSVPVATGSKEPNVLVGDIILTDPSLSLLFLCTLDKTKCAPSPALADIDECSERAIACPGLNEACINEEGSFHCDCAEGFVRRDSICVENKLPSKY